MLRQTMFAARMREVSIGKNVCGWQLGGTRNLKPWPLRLDFRMEGGRMAANEEMSALIKQITDGAFGKLMNWQRPVSLPSIGPAFPEVFDRFEREDIRALFEERLA
jgi:hypothetical protein